MFELIIIFTIGILNYVWRSSVIQTLEKEGAVVSFWNFDSKKVKRSTNKKEKKTFLQKLPDYIFLGTSGVVFLLLFKFPYDHWLVMLFIYAFWLISFFYHNYYFAEIIEGKKNAEKTKDKKNPYKFKEEDFESEKKSAKGTYVLAQFFVLMGLINWVYEYIYQWLNL